MTFSAHVPQLTAAIARSSCAVAGCVLQAECEVVVSVFFQQKENQMCVVAGGRYWRIIDGDQLSSPV